MKKIVSVFSVFVVLVIGGFTFSNAQQPEPGKYAYMMGQSITYPPLLDLYSFLQNEQLKEEFLMSTGSYEITSYLYGIKLVFNRNFILKEIQLYDSGYTYHAFQDTLPFGVSFGQSLRDYQNYKYPDFVKDTFNSYVYHYSNDVVHTKVYFRNNHPEIVKIFARDSFLTTQDQLLSKEWGMRVIPDGQCISGNCYKGFGKMYWPNGLTYEGEWDSGIPHGAGNLSDTSGFQYVGEFKLGFLWGQGKLNMPQQFTYEGELVYGKRMGEGKATFANGTWYEGEWQRDMMHGAGHYWYSKTFHYKGEFNRNQFNGKGKLFSPDGYVEGSFLNGKPHGYCEQVVTRSHTKLSGYWVNGKKEGKFSLYNPVQGTRTIQFKNDKEIQL